MRYGIKTADCLDNERLNIRNAVPTAEGALEIAMNELPVTINGSRVCVTGYGRVSKALCPRVQALGASVTVAARNGADLAWCKTLGYDTADISRCVELPRCEVIFNTVPHTIFDRMALEKISPETLIVDLASKPGGVDLEAAKELGHRVIWALSIPGKVAPVTAGRILADAVLEILSEEGVL